VIGRVVLTVLAVMILVTAVAVILASTVLGT